MCEMCLRSTVECYRRPLMTAGRDSKALSPSGGRRIQRTEPTLRYCMFIYAEGSVCRHDTVLPCSGNEEAGASGGMWAKCRTHRFSSNAHACPSPPRLHMMRQIGCAECRDRKTPPPPGAAHTGSAEYPGSSRGVGACQRRCVHRAEHDTDQPARGE